MKKNSSPLAPFILGILSILIPFVGIIFGIIGLSLSIKLLKYDEKAVETGKGFLTAGKICSIVGICMQVTSFLLTFLGFAALTVVHN